MTGVLLLLLTACQDTRLVRGALDAPTGVAYLAPEGGSPFTEPVAVVANARSGRIVALDLKRGIYLADDPGASFVRGQYLPTGARRILGDLVASAPGDGTVTLYATDALTDTLVQIPWILGADANGFPLEATPSLSAEPTFVDADGSGDKAQLGDFVLHAGAASTEDWTVTFDGTYWQVEGSRSGQESLPAQTLQPYQAPSGAFDMLISGTATAGDRFEFSSESGIREHDLGGYIESLLLLPGGARLVASVVTHDTERGQLVFFDPISASPVGTLELPDGAHPGRVATDAGGDLIYVADLARPVIYEVLVDAAQPEASPYREIAVSDPVAELAWQGEDAYENLFYAPVGANEVAVYDLIADAQRDLNPYTSDVDGLSLRAPITGMASLSDPVLLQETSDAGVRRRGRGVIISTFEGVLYVAEGESGCLAQDEDGPFAYVDGDTVFVDRGNTSNPVLWADEVTGEQAQVNPCAGIARNEQWTAVYDEVDGSWIVEGSLAGVQQGRAYEDLRYITDHGELSFLILAGSKPSTEGDRFNIQVFAGSYKVAGDVNGDGQLSSGEFNLRTPGRPIPYSYLAGPTGGGWDVVNRKVGVIWPMIGSDTVYRVNLQSGRIEAAWD